MQTTTLSTTGLPHVQPEIIHDWPDFELSKDAARKLGIVQSEAQLVACPFCGAIPNVWRYKNGLRPVICYCEGAQRQRDEEFEQNLRMSPYWSKFRHLYESKNDN